MRDRLFFMPLHDARAHAMFISRRVAIRRDFLLFIARAADYLPARHSTLALMRAMPQR